MTVIPSSLEEQLRQRADGHPERRLPGAGAFEDLADAGLVIDRAGQVDMAAARGGRLGEALELGVLVDEAERDRGAGGPAVVGPRIDDDPVGLERLPLAAPVPPLPPLQLAVDEAGFQGDARGEALDDRRQRRAVGLAGGQVAEHVRVYAFGLQGSRRGNGPPVSVSYASTYFRRVCSTTSSGKGRGRAGLVPPRGVEPVADELLVERRLGAPRAVRIQGPVPRAVGGQQLVDQQQLPGLAIEAPLEFRVGQDQAPAPRVVGGLRVHVQAQLPESPGQVGAEFPGHRRERDVLIVTHLGLGGGGEDRVDPVALDEPGGQGGAADGPRRSVLAPGAAREITADHALERDDVGLLHDHRPAVPRLAVAGERVEARVAEVGGDHVVGDVDLAEPEDAEPGQDLPLAGDAVGQDPVVRADAVGRHQQQAVAEVVDVADFPPRLGTPSQAVSSNDTPR